jgi:CTP:molybdopterin cytidylyltransferase MocA
MAAGHGRRFGGLKQLAPIGPNGEAVMDYTAIDALNAGFDTVVLIVRDEVREELLDHTAIYWPPKLSVIPVTQGPVAGTAQAVASAAPHLDGSFGIANADDLYGPEALRTLAEELEALGPDEHLIVGYHLTDTVLTAATVTRGVCETDPDGYLVVVRELSVTRHPEGEGFTARPAVGDGDEFDLSGEEIVSMNLWGFSEGIFDDLERAIARFDPDTAPHAEGKPAELLLPDVVARVVSAGLGRVRVVETKGRCIGLTHPDDVPLVRSIVAEERA